MRGKQETTHARTLRREQTEAERHLWRFLRNRRLQGFKFRRQHPIGPYYADFACPERKLVVELDGSQHLALAVEDVRRTRALQRLDYRVVRFWNDDALLRTVQVLDAIVAALHVPSPCVAPQRCPALRAPALARGARAFSRVRANGAQATRLHPRKRGEGGSGLANDRTAGTNEN